MYGPTDGQVVTRYLDAGVGFQCEDGITAKIVDVEQPTENNPHGIATVLFTSPPGWIRVDWDGSMGHVYMTDEPQPDPPVQVTNEREFTDAELAAAIDQIAADPNADLRNALQQRLADAMAKYGGGTVQGKVG